MVVGVKLSALDHEIQSRKPLHDSELCRHFAGESTENANDFTWLLCYSWHHLDTPCNLLLLFSSVIHQPEERMWAVKDLCSHYRCDRSSVYRWLKQGLPHSDIGTSPTRRCLRFKPSLVAAWFEQRKSQAKVDENRQEPVS